MCNVDRYDFEDYGTLESDGRYVRHEDYLVLQAERDQLAAENAAQKERIDDLRVQLERRGRDKQESDIGEIRVGRLPTMNQDEYPGLGDWWVHLRIGEDAEEVLARVYGATPQEANNRAEALACRAAMHGATISNSADIAIDELPQPFGNSEQLEPVSQPYTLRDGLAAIRKLGPIDAEKIQAERDALNEPTCWCLTCRPVTMTDMRFVVCPECGNKRCPRANDHRNACSGSNEPGQDGSAYPAAPKQERE